MKRGGMENNLTEKQEETLWNAMTGIACMMQDIEIKSEKYNRPSEVNPYCRIVWALDDAHSILYNIAMGDV